MLQRYLLIWLTALSWIAAIWPDIWGAESFDPFTGSKPYLFWMVAATMFAVGMLLPPDEIREVARRWPVVAAGTSIQYTAMPLLAFSVSRLFGLSGEDLIGVVIVGCVPGAMASNVLTLNARGNTSYSVSLTTAATLLSPIVVPLILSLVLSADVGVKPQTLWDTSYKLFMNVVLPVLLGQLLMRLLSWRSAKLASTAKVLADVVAHLAILWIIAVVVGLNRQHLVQFPTSILAALLMINIGGYSIGYGAGLGLRMPEGMRRALTLEVGMQNAGLGAALAASLFENSDLNGDRIAMAPAFYTFGCMLTGSVLAKYWSFHSPAPENPSEAAK